MPESDIKQKGYIISLVTFLVLIIMSSMAVSMGFLVADMQARITNAKKSTQSYYAAEAGIEDALLYLKKYPQTSSADYDLNVNNATTNVGISSVGGISRSITSQADNAGITKKIRAICNIDNATGASFYYGVQVGEGGLVMKNGSEVMGNVFSGGNVSGSGLIRNNLIVSGNGHSISGVHVMGNAMAYSCLSPAVIDGHLTYVTGGLHTCEATGGESEQSEEISQQPMPIPQETIDEWKQDAENGQVFFTSQTISGTKYLGPAKINGNLTVNIGATLIVEGTIYVTGSINLQNNATIKLDQSYGPGGGFIVCDGTITINNNNTFLGSGQEGSYLMMVSTSTSDLAIDVLNNAQGVVLYAINGGITVHNNVSLTEATGYKITLLNNAIVQYSSGIVNIYFASGPAGGWKVVSWREY